MADIEAGSKEEAMEKLGYGKPSTPRTKFLKDTIWWKHTRGGEYAEEGIMMDMDRARMVTQSWKETENQALPHVIRRAKMVEKVLDGVTIWIRDKQLLVGANASAPNLIPWSPEGSKWLTLDLLETDYFTPEEQEEATKIMEFWDGKRVADFLEAEVSLPEEYLRVYDTGVLQEPRHWQWLWDSPAPPYEEIAVQGMNKRIEMIEKREQELYNELLEETWHKPECTDNVEKISQLKAMAIASKALIRWARRHARLAKIIAENFDVDPEWKKDLLEIHRVCSKVPAEPCETLQEVLQMQWFIFIACDALERELCGASMILDALIEPYLKHDLETGRLTYEQAVEMLECHRMLYSEKGRWSMRHMREMNAGANELFIITLGGVRADGSDACGIATNAVLDAAFNIRTAEPSLGFKWHSKANVETLGRVFNCVKTGLGYPSIKNDELNVDQMCRYGATIEEARHWALVLCMSPGPIGRMGQRQRCVQDQWSAKHLELLFNHGFDSSFTGMQLIPREICREDPTTYTSADEILPEWANTVRWVQKVAWLGSDLTRKYQAKYFQQPLLSSMFDGCIEKGEDCTVRDEFPNYWSGIIYLTDVADSLAALQKLVFDEKKYTLKEVVEAMREDWEGYEEMRRDFLNVTKWGNDDDYVDNWMIKVRKAIADVVGEVVPPSPKYRTKDEPAPVLPLPQTLLAYATWGPRIGALPNGRKQGDPMADGGVSPWAGHDKKGPTAVFNSIGKLDQHIFKASQFNQRLNPDQMKGEKGFQLWLNYMKTWHDLGIDHIQFNCTSNQVLRAAQQDPEKYSDVIVRVAGYSARFIDLNAYTQNSIIARNEQNIGAFSS